jgi:hypothetical protein
MGIRGRTITGLIFIIVIAGAILAIPYIKRALENGKRENVDPLKENEKLAVKWLRVIHKRQEVYRKSLMSYGKLSDLSNFGLIDHELGGGKKSGYVFKIGKVTTGGYECTAVPQARNVTGVRGFYIDESGVVRFTEDGSEPAKESPVLEEKVRAVK